MASLRASWQCFRGVPIFVCPAREALHAVPVLRGAIYPAALLGAVLLLLGWSSIGPYDRFTWFLEVAPVLVGIPILLSTFARFPLTPLLYTLLAVHAAVLIVGGHYTYAEVPLGFWIQDAFGLARNHYDRIGHFVQGFVPAILARELLLRLTPLRVGKWLFFLVVCVCLAFSAFYELVEWWVAAATGSVAEAFLGTQGLGHTVGHVSRVDRRSDGTASIVPSP